MTPLTLFRLVSLYHLRRNKLRTVFVLLIIAIGSTSMFIAVDAIYKRDDSRRFGASLLHGHAAITVDARANAAITNDVLDAIRSENTVELATPLVFGQGLLVDQRLSLAVIGIDPLTEQDIRPYTLVDGVFLTEPGQALITDVFTDEIAVGDSVRVAGDGGIMTYTVVGMLAQESIAALNGGDMLFLHYADVHSLRQNTSFDAVSVIPAESISQTQDTLQATLTDGVDVRNLTVPKDKTLTDAVIDILGIISNGLPAVLGALIITSTLAASIAQRRKELAILRAIGTTQRGILTMMIIEAIMIGLIASLLGIGLALLLNQGGLAASVTVDTFEATAPDAQTPLWVYGCVTITAVIMAIGAMWVPARRIVRIAPTEAMRPPQSHTDKGRIKWWRVAAGLALLLLAVIGRIAFDNSAMVPLAVLTGILFVVSATVLLFPPLVIAMSRLLPAILRQHFGFGGMIATQNLNIRHQQAIATGLTALLVIWFYVLLLGFSAGQRNIATRLVNTEFNWDLIVAGPGEDARTTAARIPPDVVESIRSRDDVQQVAAERLAPYTLRDTAFIIRAVDLDAYLAAGNRFSWESGNESVAYDRLREHEAPAVLIGGFDALLLGLRQSGTTLTLATPAGDVTVDVVGTINAPGGNTIVMDRALYVNLWDDTQIDRLNLTLTDSADAKSVRRDLAQTHAAAGLTITDQAAIRALFAPAAGSDFVIGLILFPFMMIGITNMFFISVLDRRREFGMLRAIGTFRQQLVAGVILEALLLVSLAYIVAVPMAFAAMELMLFGRIAGADVRPDVTVVVQSLVLIMIVTGIAVYLPARRAGRMDILDALRYE